MRSEEEGAKQEFNKMGSESMMALGIALFE
jgi:hypothetical protein